MAMELRGKRVLVCNCEETMALDAKALGKACLAVGAEGELELNSQLCRRQLGNYQSALAAGQPLLVACTQEAPLFRELASEEQPDADLSFVNIRERAGWSDEGAGAPAKMAALIAEATEALQPNRAVAMESTGICLIYGPGTLALEAAKQLAGRLEVTLLLTETKDLLPLSTMESPIFSGRVRRAEGHLGAFMLDIQDFAAAKPSARGALVFDAPQASAKSECDLILDLTGGTPLFSAHQRRDGYLRPDPGDPIAVQKALFELTNMIGQFEKPRYVTYDAGLCAHARNRLTGCTRCLDICPTSAITSNVTEGGDGVTIDPYVCGGCGSCASVCPTGAATYDFPQGDGLFRRLRSLLAAYRQAGGEAPLLLLHDERHGDELITLMARLGRGLPARVLPVAVNEVTQVGLDFLAAALAYGATGIAILAGPEKQGELSGLAQQIGLAETLMEGLGYGGGRIQVVEERDPDAVAALLYGWERRDGVPAGSFLPMGGKRARTTLALAHLHDKAPTPLDILPLPAGAPFGALAVDTAGCTLCLACVGACPTGALLDSPEKPHLGFREEACVQCGLCRNTCPENVITLLPRFNFTDAGKSEVTLNEAEPAECIRCGKQFGVKQSIERIAAKLEGHSMFADQTQIDRIRMCEDCRVVVQFEDKDMPMAMGTRPVLRTTDDDLREREIEEARAKLLAERAAEGGGDENGGENKG